MAREQKNPFQRWFAPPETLHFVDSLLAQTIVEKAKLLSVRVPANSMQTLPAEDHLDE